MRKPIPPWVNNLSQLKSFEGNEAFTSFAIFSERGIITSKRKLDFAPRTTPFSKFNFNATSPINALLNFGYSLLEAIVRKNILAVGLLPEVGFVHEIASGKEPLVYDMEEPFRNLVDESVLQILPKMSNRDFTYDRKTYNLRLKPSTCNLVLQTLSQTLEEKREYRGEMWRTESIILDYVRTLAKSLTEGKIPEFGLF